MNRLVVGLFATMGVVVLIAIMAGVRVMTSPPEPAPRSGGGGIATPSDRRGPGERSGPAAVPMGDPRIEILELRKEIRELRGQLEWLKLKYEGRGAPPSAGGGAGHSTPPSGEAPPGPGDRSGGGAAPGGKAVGDFSGPALSGQMEAMQAEIDTLKAQVGALADLADKQVDAVLPSLSPQELIERGKLAQQSGRSDLAHRYFDYFLKQFPNDPGAADAVYTMGQDAISLSKPDQAIDYFERLRRDFPDYKLTPYAYFYLGMAHGQKGDLDTAVRYYQESIPHLKDNVYYEVAAIYNMGDLYLEHQDRVSARGQFQRIVTEFQGIESVKSIVEEAAERLQEIDSGK
ncbi:MAG: tetratricopeptide repeat protein [Planctomycetes bacterium]|nr:tetratricopeptide repeat protein [Planctomycetota bacterium]